MDELYYQGKDKSFKLNLGLIKELIGGLRLKKGKIPREVKIALRNDLVRNGTSIRQLAQSLNISRTSVHRWVNEVKGEALSGDVPSVPVVSLMQQKNDFPFFIFNFLKKSIFFLVIFLLFESFLIKEGLLLQESVFETTGLSALLKVLIAEIAPILFAYFLCIGSNLFFKFFCFTCLLICFSYSIFSVTGRAIREHTEKENMYQIEIEKKKILEKELIGFDEKIDFFSNLIQSNGKKGWPLTMKKIIDRKSKTLQMLRESQVALSSMGSIDNQRLNLLFDVLLKLIAQVVSVLLFHRIQKLLEIASSQNLKKL